MLNGPLAKTCQTGVPIVDRAMWQAINQNCGSCEIASLLSSALPHQLGTDCNQDPSINSLITDAKVPTPEGFFTFEVEVEGCSK